MKILLHIILLMFSFWEKKYYKYIEVIELYSSGGYYTKQNLFKIIQSS